MSQAVLVDDLLILAREYRQAYYDLRQVAPISWPRYFLFCHSIELVLKAYLVQAAGPDRETTPRPALQAQYQEPPQSGDQMWSVLECQYQSEHWAPHGGTYEALATLSNDKGQHRLRRYL